MRNTFIGYFPNNFTYEGIVGGGFPDPTVNLEADGSYVITSDNVADKICRIASDLLAPDSALDGDTEDSDGDSDGEGADIDVDTVPLTEPYCSDDHLPSNAPTEKNGIILRDFESLIACTYTFDTASLTFNVSSSLDSKYSV